MTESTENQTIDEERLGDVRAIIKSLAKFIHGKKIYAKNNPTLVKFAKEFDAGLQAFFQREDELVLAIEQYRITWCSESVYDNEKREESLAFLLHKDGIGEISILSSVTFAEIEEFADLVKNEIHRFEPDDDVVTKLWKADFDAISYRVLDEYLVGEFGEGRPDDGEQSPLETEDHPDLPSFEDKGRVIVEAKDTGLQSINTYLYDLAEQGLPDGTRAEREEYFQNIVGSLFQVSSEELRMFHAELEQENQQDPLVQFHEVMLDFLLGDNPSVVRDATNIIEGILDFLILEGNPEALSVVLLCERNFINKKTLTSNVQSFLARSEDRIADPKVLLSLSAEMERGTWSAESVFGFYCIIGPNAIPTICSLLETLQGERLHRAACDTLLAIAGDDISKVVDNLNLDTPHVAKDVVYLIERSGATDLPELIEELMYYPDKRVREEVIGYLSKAGTDASIVLLSRLLDDDDKHIRTKTLHAIADLRSDTLMDKLIDLAFDKEKKQRAFDEQELIFRTVGKHAGEAILSDITKMARKKNFMGLGKQSTRQNKLLAVSALHSIGTDAALDLLDELARDPDDLVKSKARRALEKLTTTGGGK